MEKFIIPSIIAESQQDMIERIDKVKDHVKLMQLDTSSLRRLGWAPKYSSEESVRLTARAVSSLRS